MKALVTGAAGFIGSHLTRTLIGQGASVVGVDCFTDYYPRWIKALNLEAAGTGPQFTFVERALADCDWPRMLDGITHVFHLAAQAGVRKSWGRDFRTYTVNNIEGTQLLLEACVGRPIQRLVYASSSSVYGDNATIPMREDALPQPVSPYGVSKLAAEQLCYLYHVNHGVPTVALRYFTVYGPRQRPDMAFHRFIKAGIRREPIHLYGDGEQTRDFTFVSDAVAATAAAGVRGLPGQVYNIGGGSRVSINHVLEQIGGIVGHPLDIRRESSQKGDMKDTYADTTRARLDLAFNPRVSLAEGLQAEYDWLKTSPILEA